MHAELTKLITAYYDFCVKEQKRLAKETKNPIVPIVFTFEGFYEWLKSNNKESK